MKKLIPALLLLPTLVSCTHNFQVTNENFDQAGKTIAVVSGTSFPSTDMLASLLSSELSGKAVSRVMPYADVKGILGNSHRRIRGPYKNAYIEIEEDYTLTDTDALREISEKLGADCLIVLWTPVELRDVMIPRRGHTALDPVTIRTVHVICQLYIFPGAVEAGHAMDRIDYVIGDSYEKTSVDPDRKKIPSKEEAFRTWCTELADGIGGAWR